MKHRLNYCALVTLLLITSSHTSARLLSPKQGDEKLKDFAEEVSFAEMDSDDSLSQMGLEICENEGDECLKRRVIEEAHLDYIYTQHYKP